MRFTTFIALCEVSVFTWGNCASRSMESRARLREVARTTLRYARSRSCGGRTYELGAQMHGTPRNTSRDMSRRGRGALPAVMAALLGIGAMVLAPVGTSPVGAAVAPGYTAVTPERLMDTRENLGGPLLVGGATRSLQVAGRGGVPAVGAIAVVLNVTVTQPAAAGFVTVWPSGVTRPLASNLNMTAGATVPNLVTVGLGAGGQVDLFSSADAHLVVDLVGWYSSGLVPVTPGRLMDTREGLGGLVLGAGETRELQVAGREGVPATGAIAVALNVTVVDPTGAGFLTVWPTATRPTASNLNFVGLQTIANSVLVGLGPDGKVRIFNSSGTTDVVVDVAGWFDSGFSSAVPDRLMDTREGLGGPLFGPGETRDLEVLGHHGVPATGVAAVALNVTATEPSSSPFITVWPAGIPRPKASNLNVVAGRTVPNAVVVGVGADGKISLFNSAGTTHLVVDVTGWYPTPSVGDVTAPAISSISVGSITSTSASIGWATDEPATGRVDYGTTAAYGSSTTLASGLTISHTRVVSGLQPATTYHYRVRSIDAAGNERVSADATFTTSSAALSFAPAAAFASGTHSHGVAAVDVRGSSALDVVVANAGVDTVTVFQGDGTGTFPSSPSATYAVGDEPKAVMAGQLNAGGVLDLVTANQGTGDISVLMGNGSGGFAAAVSYPACPGAHEPALADLDGDSDIDIAVACWGSSTIRVLRNNGSGVFASVATPLSGARPHSIVAFDADGDGDRDLAVANLDDDTVTIMRNDTGMVFVPQPPIPVGAAPHSIRSADLDDDGDADLVTANQAGNSVSVLRRNVGPLSYTRTDFATGPTPKSVAIADLNGDGDLDVITANINGNYPTVVNADGNAVSILLGNGDGSLRAPAHLADPGTPFAVIAADVNADGLLDLVTANWHGGAMTVLRRLT